MPTIDIDGLRLNYSDTGSGIAVVFVPGICGSKEWFCYQSAGLSDHYRVISYDLRRVRGAGNSLQTLADDLAGLLTALKIHEAVIGGYSLGGLVALQFALDHADRCVALVLSSTAPSFDRISAQELESDLVLGEVKSESVWAKLWQRLVGPRQTKEDVADPLDYLAWNNCNADRATLDARLKLLRETDLGPVLPEVEVPALIVAGSAEKPYILAGSQLLDQGLSDSSLEIIEDTDQFHFYTRHDVFNSIVADFLSHKIARL